VTGEAESEQPAATEELELTEPVEQDAPNETVEEPGPTLYQILTEMKYPPLGAALEAFIEAGLPEFKEVLVAHPLQNPENGHCSVGEAFWLYWLVKSLEPKVVIESGSLEGYSLWFLRQAAPQGSRVLAFDPHNEPAIPLDGIDFYPFDWMETNLNALPGRETLVFFDDHFNQRVRVEQCVWRRIRHTAFHDNYTRPDQGHLPLRYAGLADLVRCQFIFPDLRCDPVFTDYETNRQAYRWLTYCEINVGVLG